MGLCHGHASWWALQQVLMQKIKRGGYASVAKFKK
jgi:hypothetical protein